MAAVAGELGLEINVGGVTQWNEVLSGVQHRIEDLRPALEVIANQFQAHMKDVFYSQGALQHSGPWDALSPKYARWKQKHYPGKGILQATGALRIAMEGGTGAIREISAQELEVGGARLVKGDLDLGLLHQEGTERMPMRPIIDIPDPVESGFIHELADHLWRE